MKRLLAILLSLPLIFNSLAALAASPAEMISDFRLKQGEGRVTMDFNAEPDSVGPGKGDGRQGKT